MISEELETTLFTIISMVGAARSSYIEAIDLAIEDKIEEAEAKVAEGEELFIEGHKAHLEMIQHEAQGDTQPITLLTIHAEDQLMSAETFKIIATKAIAAAKRKQAK